MQVIKSDAKALALLFWVHKVSTTRMHLRKVKQSTEWMQMVPPPWCYVALIHEWTYLIDTLFTLLSWILESGIIHEINSKKILLKTIPEWR